MSCDLSAWAKQACADNGGIDEIIVYEIEDRDTFTVANNVVTAITMDIGKKAFRWTPDMESANATETTTRSRENNSVMHAQTVTVTFKDDLDATVQLIEAVAKGFIGVIIKKSDPEDAVYRHYGALNGMTIETVEGVQGQLYEDLRGHTLNFVGKELAKAPAISDTLVDSILVPAS